MANATMDQLVQVRSLLGEAIPQVRQLNGIERAIGQAEEKLRQLNAEFERRCRDAEKDYEQRTRLHQQAERSALTKTNAQKAALVEINSQVSAAETRLAEVKAQTNSAKIEHDRICASMVSLRQTLERGAKG